ncbi:hypothetical protein TIFTF001_040549 [Ficus carica]|uniref:Uncharacterized protein n=1 Tax=Ficus carica TaxID=3494 RepID=A0AA87YV41_FICCA|nr:hypothetical protein TIFTF001_040549 [Ficus carica]
MKLIRLSLSFIWLIAMAVAATAQNPVLDTTGRPVRRGVEYYIKPTITDNGGRFTLINRNNSCPLYVGQENSSAAKGLPVTFAPFFEDINVVREARDFKVAFAALTICGQSTTWQLDGELIGTGDDWPVRGGAKGKGENPKSQAKTLDSNQGIDKLYVPN